MPIDTTPSTVATSALQGIPFSSLMGGPLNAAIEAQVNAAKSTVDFIQNVGLTGPAENRRPIQVEFIYYVDGRETKLMVPLLTIVPIPYLAVDEVDINFKASISAAASTHQEDSSSSETKASGGLDASIGYGPFSAKAHFEASYSSKKDSKATQDSKYSVEYTMDVHIHAKQESMPAGLAKVLNILEQSIAPTEAKETFRLTPERLAITDPSTERTIRFTATVYDNQGKRASGKTITVTLPDQTPTTPYTFAIEPTTIPPSNADGEVEFTVKFTPPATPTTNDTSEKTLELEVTFAAVKKRIPVTIPKLLKQA
ncbi:DUF2589 domain-containing protein [Nostoc sp. 2RC]|uniref:DUF2589 domain-containing protein n=1 Tax=Nostoc sp. 2RC TaxID=2485484 RepID=UPI0016267571|nr:DUF2589 domain-containing protein [Nostoc sp. 2RC]MBC1239130.1 DUF2589 domain-containing protein [Nostoc sp. 2RC]